MDGVFGKSLGAVIDSGMEDFQRECAFLSYGNMVSLRNVLELTYYDLVSKREGVLMLPKNDDNQSLLLGIYAEMQKIEDKVVWLGEVLESRKLPPPAV